LTLGGAAVPARRADATGEADVGDAEAPVTRVIATTVTIAAIVDRRIPRPPQTYRT
jgi:hypothetical protein